jgi:Ca-activated chloride channel family protein
LFKFAHTYYFYLFLLIPALTLAFAWFLLWRRNALSRFGEWAVIRQLVPEASAAKLILKFVVAMLAAAFLVLTLAGPQTGSRIEKAHRKGIDLMIALDVSNSMLAEDIKPNRLERSKQSILRLIDQLDGDRIGIIVFAGKAYTQLPITTDYAAAKLFVSAISTDIIPTQGSAMPSHGPLPLTARRRTIKPSSSSPTARTTRGMSSNRLKLLPKQASSSIPSEWGCPTGRRSPSTTGK